MEIFLEIELDELSSRGNNIYFDCLVNFAYKCHTDIIILIIDAPIVHLNATEITNKTRKKGTSTLNKIRILIIYMNSYHSFPFLIFFNISFAIYYFDIEQNVKPIILTIRQI